MTKHAMDNTMSPSSSIRFEDTSADRRRPSAERTIRSDTSVRFGLRVQLARHEIYNGLIAVRVYLRVLDGDCSSASATCRVALPVAGS